MTEKRKGGRRSAPDHVGRISPGESVITQLDEAAAFVAQARKSSGPIRLSFVEDHHVADVLKDMKKWFKAVDARTRRALKLGINEVLAYSILYRALHPKTAPYVTKELAGRAFETAKKLKTLMEKLAIEFAEEADPFGRGHPHAMPSVYALKLVAIDYENLDRIARTAKDIKSRAIERIGAQRRQPDYVRYLMILGLSNVYERVFHQQPSATINGPWCTFLEGILSACEPKSTSDAYGLWLSVRKECSRGGIVNSNFKAIFNSLGEMVEITTTGGNTVLTDSQEPAAAIQVVGRLVSDANVIFSGRDGLWIIENYTQGDFTVTAKLASQIGVVVPQGELALISCKGADMRPISTPRSPPSGEMGFN